VISILLSADLFILLLISYLLIAIYHVVIVHTVYMHKHFSFSYTLTGLLFDDPGFVRSDIGRFLILFRCTLSLYASRGAGVSLFLILIHYLFLFLYFLDSYISDSVFISFIISFDIMRGYLYVILH